MAANDPDHDVVHVSMDPDIGIYESTRDLEERLANRGFESKVRDPSKLEIVKEVRQDMKPVDDRAEFAKKLEELTRNTLNPQDVNKRQLNAARVCEIETRLRTDISLRLEDASDEMEYQSDLDGAAAAVKNKLVTSYLSLKKNSSTDHQESWINNLEDRIKCLKSV